MAGVVETITWRPVADGLPDADLTVNVATEGCEEPVWLGCFDGEVWCDTEGMEISVTHWAPMLAGPAGVAVGATGREPELLQDCDRRLSRALASTPDARLHAREAAAAAGVPEVEQRICSALGGRCEWEHRCSELGRCAYGVALPLTPVAEVRAAMVLGKETTRICPLVDGGTLPAGTLLYAHPPSGVTEAEPFAFPEDEVSEETRAARRARYEEWLRRDRAQYEAKLDRAIAAAAGVAPAQPEQEDGK